MAVSQWKDQEPISCSAHEAGYLSWSSVLEERVANSGKECLISRTDELVIKSEGKQAKSKSLLSSMSFLVGCHMKWGGGHI